MKKLFLLVLTVLIPLFIQESLSQIDNNKQEIQELRQRIDELESKFAFQGFYGKYNFYSSQLAISLNRNFTYFGYLDFVNSEEMSDGKTKATYQFSGYQSIEGFNSNMRNSNYINVIRGNLMSIRRVIVDNDEFWSADRHRNHLIIKYYDNAGNSEPFIVADTDLNSLKVRINGVLTEVGWE